MKTNILEKSFNVGEKHCIRVILDQNKNLALFISEQDQLGQDDWEAYKETLEKLSFTSVEISLGKTNSGTNVEIKPEKTNSSTKIEIKPDKSASSLSETLLLKAKKKQLFLNSLKNSFNPPETVPPTQILDPLSSVLLEKVIFISTGSQGNTSFHNDVLSLKSKKELIYGHTFSLQDESKEKISAKIANAISTLETVEINGDILTNEIIKAIRNTKTLKTFRLSGDDLQWTKHPLFSEFLDAVSKNTSITKLELSPQFKDQHVSAMLGLGKNQTANQNIKEVSVIDDKRQDKQERQRQQQRFTAMVEQRKRMCLGIEQEFDIGEDHCVRVTWNKENNTLTLLILERQPLTTNHEAHKMPGYDGHRPLQSPTNVQEDELDKYREILKNFFLKKGINIEIKLNAEAVDDQKPGEGNAPYIHGINKTYKGKKTPTQILDFAPLSSMQLGKVIFISTRSEGNLPFHNAVLSLHAKELVYGHTFSFINEEISSKIANAISTLETVELESNILTDEIIRAIESTTTLKKLVLRSQQPTDSLCNAIRKNKSITILILSDDFYNQDVSQILGLEKDQKVNECIKHIFFIGEDSERELITKMIEQCDIKRLPYSLSLQRRRKDFLDLRTTIVDNLPIRKAEGEQALKDEKYEEAIKALQWCVDYYKDVKKEPAPAELCVTLAQAYEKNGDYTNAITYYTKAMDWQDNKYQQYETKCQELQEKVSNTPKLSFGVRKE